MSGIFGAMWPILRSYRPNATRDRQNAAPVKFGAFEATYTPVRYGVGRPKTDAEAQRLYNHIRTIAFWLDAAPLLSDLGLPFRAGLDDIISLVPIYGDIVSGFIQLYQVWLCFVFGVPRNVVIQMVFNVILDVIVGLVPLIGDFIDNLWKSNLRNLALLEAWLLTGGGEKKYHILLMPESQEFMPRPKGPGGFSSWLGGGSKLSKVEEREREKERRTGKVRATRRMDRSEGIPVPVEVPISEEAPEPYPRA
ncbi:hypothetical protein BD324DRAFT_329992 [Kockovaella imperatae]|uniref:Uncharacterized protein n=1 Tax=Kockovaella imperatae TaxID=4999 RepID=A0A1Y1UMY2_9TREE|nr:hypothetical protein BD324DRAFT_329992 [Kockovaella imperatae]ORX39411.1 hypothetical protein BD324DRAFT_329992 [Kockovaella imperatae]